MSRYLQCFNISFVMLISSTEYEMSFYRLCHNGSHLNGVSSFKCYLVGKLEQLELALLLQMAILSTKIFL